MDKVLERIWNEYRDRFPFISIGVVLSTVVALLTTGILSSILPPEYTLSVGMIGVDLILAGIFISVRDRKDVFEGVEAAARFFFSFIVFLIPLLALILLPPPLQGLSLVYTLLFLTVPVILGDLGFTQGLKKIKNLFSKRCTTFIGLNTILFILLLLISMLTPPAVSFSGIEGIAAFVSLILVLFLFAPLYIISGLVATGLDRGR